MDELLKFLSKKVDEMTLEDIERAEKIAKKLQEDEIASLIAQKVLSLTEMLRKYIELKDL